MARRASAGTSRRSLSAVERRARPTTPKPAAPAAQPAPAGATIVAPKPAAAIPPADVGNNPADPMLGGKDLGPSIACISVVQIRKTRIINENVVMFQVGNRWYRSDLPERCIGLQPSSGIADRSYGNTLCAGRPFSYYQPGEAARAGIIQSGCSYGQFSPYELPKNPAG